MTFTENELWVRFACAALAGLSGRDDTSTKEDADHAAVAADKMVERYAKRFEDRPVAIVSDTAGKEPKEHGGDGDCG